MISRLCRLEIVPPMHWYQCSGEKFTPRPSLIVLKTAFCSQTIVFERLQIS